MVLSTLFAVLAVGVVPLEIVIALFPLVLARASSFNLRAHFDPTDPLLRFWYVANDEADELRLW